MKNGKLAPKTRTCLITVGAFILLAFLLLLGRSDGFGSSDPNRLPDTEDRVSFLLECGWNVDPETEEEQTIHIPEVFSPVYEDYNALQLQQGYDLSDYAGRDCVLYTYSVTNYPDESQTVIADLYLYRNRVIGGDVHSTNLNGFMIGLK